MCHNNNLKYYIRTTRERELDSSFSQIHYKLLIDNEHKNVEAFIKQLEKIKEFNCVIMEDDIRLCKNFKERIEEEINKRPNDIINFFPLPSQYIEPSYGNWRDYCYNQCVYFPSSKIKEILECYKNNDISDNIGGISCEAILKKIFKKLDIKYYRYRPCLIQHLDYLSIIQKNKSLKRRSIYFIDYLDELNISYEDAKLEENKIKLTELLKRDFEGD